MKDILIIAHFAELPEENDNCRFMYLYKMLNNEGYNVEIIGSSFCHAKKQQRVSINEKCFTPIYEPGYKKNVSIKRLYSHRVMAKNLKRYLKQRVKPDMIYCAVPSLDVAEVAAEYAQDNGVTFVIDVQDIWPEAFKMVVNIPILSDILFFPMKKRADKIYRSADRIVAVSETYKERAKSVNFKDNKGISVFLGTELSRFDAIISIEQFERTRDEFWIGYVGTLGHSYDLKVVIDAISLLEGKSKSNVRFVVMGDGPLENTFKEYAEKKGILSWFTGRLPYTEMITILSNCDVAVNPISAGAAQSIINKVGDYAAAGIPVLNTQECIEYRKLVLDYKCGYNCNNNDANDLAEKITLLYENSDLTKKMGKNNRRLAEEKFDREQTYKKIVSVIIDE